MQSTEKWQAVTGFEGLYEVSDLARVRSLDRTVIYSDGRERFYCGRILSQHQHRFGYKAVHLNCEPGRSGKFTRTVHSLVLEAFAARPGAGYEVLHINGDATDSRLVNLRWGTHAENMRQMSSDGNSFGANKTHCPSRHPYDDTNTGRTKDGRRYCRSCLRTKSAARRLRERLNHDR